MGAFGEEWHKKTPLNTENIIFFHEKKKNTNDDDSPRLIKNNVKT